jgi:hypothetical protein
MEWKIKDAKTIPVTVIEFSDVWPVCEEWFIENVSSDDTLEEAFEIATKIKNMGIVNAGNVSPEFRRVFWIICNAADIDPAFASIIVVDVV